ncbi:MAG: hypothetical protein WBG86_04300 [Polyangiales bacterium]
MLVSLLLIIALGAGCSHSTGHQTSSTGIDDARASDTATPRDEAARGEPAAPTTDDPDLYSNRAVGISLRKPSSWFFVHGSWNRGLLDRVTLSDEEMGSMMKRFATEPVILIMKYEDTHDGLIPLFKVVARPLGALRDASLDELAALMVRMLPHMSEELMEVDDVGRTTIAGRPAAHLKLRTTFKDARTGEQYQSIGHNWMVKRGDQLFMLGGSGPAEGPDAPLKDFEAILETVVIEPRP